MPVLLRICAGPRIWHLVTIDIYSVVGQQRFVLLTFFNRSAQAVGWFVFRIFYLLRDS